MDSPSAALKEAFKMLGKDLPGVRSVLRLLPGMCFIMLWARWLRSFTTRLLYCSQVLLLRAYSTAAPKPMMPMVL